MSVEPMKYIGDDGKPYFVQEPLEIFKSRDLNGSMEWRVSGVESDSYFILDADIHPEPPRYLSEIAERKIRNHYKFKGVMRFRIQD